MAPRILFYVQHLLGIGHWQRAAALAAAMQREGLAVTLLSGGPAETRPPSGVALIQLPPARAADASFSRILDEAGQPINDAFKAERRAAVLAAFAEVTPQILLLESFPFGRRAFRFELLPLIAAARSRTPRPAVLSSIRDILVARDDRARTAEIVAAVRADFDCVLVHGDAALIPLEASFPGTVEIADRLIYTGYVGSTDEGADDGSSGSGEVIVSAGGGAVGGKLLEAALAARPLSPLATHRWRLLSGPHLPVAEYARLAAALPEGVSLERYRPDFPAMLRRCALSISQAGYNTVLDLLRARARAVLVPFAAARETEQNLRAEWLARRGRVQLLREEAISPQSLADAIAAAIAAPPPDLFAMQQEGATVSARFVANLSRKRGW
jgi:predicted glycosyltransferase